MESAAYLQQIKDRYRLTSDYALARQLGITQPEANLIRRGRKVPNPEVCIRMAKLLDRNPVELLLVAQKDKAPAKAKEYWNLALTAVNVMLNVPQRPRYLPKKVQAIGEELRQLGSQALCYEGALAHVEAIRLMESTRTSVDAVMERWELWRKGEPLYPNYLLVNQEAVRRRVMIRRLLIFTRAQLADAACLSDALAVMEDQRQAGIAVFVGIREELERTVIFQRLAEAFRIHGETDEINAALFDGEMLIFSRAYHKVPLGLTGNARSITHIDRLQFTWKPEHLRDLNPLPLFELTRYVTPFRGKQSFRAQVKRWIKT
ncbi:MAG: XRE family transcriptional regulator [Nitrospirae bacterium]|nr:MAG: XRE family transcriptional regulator [Nitrospirota bacterium]